jgi:hypothetical protein
VLASGVCSGLVAIVQQQRDADVQRELRLGSLLVPIDAGMRAGGGAVLGQRRRDV